MSSRKITVEAIKAMKGRSKIPALTAYDYPMAKTLDEAGVPIILVGDSLGMVVLGFPDTTHVTMEMMVHHTSAAARSKPNGLLVADLPYGAAKTPDSATTNAQRLIEAGAEAVKIEGGIEILSHVQAMRAAGISVMGHLGMLPQRVKDEGGYKIKGKTEEQVADLIDAAKQLEPAGVFAFVLELIKPEAAEKITNAIKVPTIGIGSGPSCDGQILVTHDLIGTFPWFTPRFVTPRLQGAQSIKTVVQDWIQELTT